MWNLKNKPEYNKKKKRLTVKENKLVITGREREGRKGRDRGRGLRGTNYSV